MLQYLLQMSEYTGVQLLKFPKMVLIVCLLTIKYLLISIKALLLLRKAIDSYQPRPMNTVLIN